MNTANLQLEGVYAVLAALLQTLRDKSILSDAEIGQMLAEVERSIASDGGRPVEGVPVEIDLADVTYYVGHETIVPREDGQGLPVWQEALYAVMGRNAARISDYLKLPCDNVVEIGREIEI